MFGFSTRSPEKIHPQFIEAFRDERHRGFELSWLEFEILRYAEQERPISDIYEKMVAEYGKEFVKHKSNFYRRIDNLIEKGYLLDRSKEDQSIQTRSIITIDKGHLELGRLSRFFFERQLRDIIPQFWLDVLDKTLDTVGNILTQKLGIVAADYNVINDLVEFTRQALPEKYSKEDLAKANGAYYYINYGDSMANPPPGTNVMNCEFDDWPLKKDYLDTIYVFNAVSTFPDKNILDEPIRVLKPGGYLILTEITELGSALVTSIFKSVAMMANMIMQNTVWKMNTELMKVEEVIEYLGKYDNLELVGGEPIQDVVTTVFILRKK